MLLLEALLLVGELADAADDLLVLHVHSLGSRGPAGTRAPGSN
jgi:hypothetical protein